MKLRFFAMVLLAFLWAALTLGFLFLIFHLTITS